MAEEKYSYDLEAIKSNYDVKPSVYVSFDGDGTLKHAKVILPEDEFRKIFKVSPDDPLDRFISVRLSRYPFTFDGPGTKLENPHENVKIPENVLGVDHNVELSRLTKTLHVEIDGSKVFTKNELKALETVAKNYISKIRKQSPVPVKISEVSFFVIENGLLFHDPEITKGLSDDEINNIKEAFRSALRYVEVVGSVRYNRVSDSIKKNNEVKQDNKISALVSFNNNNKIESVSLLTSGVEVNKYLSEDELKTLESAFKSILEKEKENLIKKGITKNLA